MKEAFIIIRLTKVQCSFYHIIFLIIQNDFSIHELASLKYKQLLVHLYHFFYVFSKHSAV